MTSLPVNKIGSMLARGISSETGTASTATNSLSFESVWSNHTERQNQSEQLSGKYRTERKKDDFVAGNSLRTKDAHKNVTNPKEDTRKFETSSPEDMDRAEWEKAMEVLSTAAVKMMTQVADAFDMSVDEVQALMTELDMSGMDVLQQEGLSQLILSAAGAENATELLTDEALYQKLQTLTGQLNDVWEECSEVLQTDAEALIQLTVENADGISDFGFMTETEPEKVTVGQDEHGSLPSQELTDDVIQDGAPLVSGAEAKDNGANQTKNQLQKQGDEQNRSTSENAANKTQSGNLLLQNLKAEGFEPQLQQLSETVSAWDSDTLDIMKQVMDYMKIQVKPDMSNLEMQLHPESLGSLQIHVASKGGNITAQFVTQNESVKAALESQMIQLKESFAEQGIKVDAIEVTVQTHQFEQNLEQGRSRQQEETGRRTRTRRIQLDGAFSIDEGNSMESEEQLAAEMMAANGNSVDYTA